MTIGKELTSRLQKLVLRVEDDLRNRLEEEADRKTRWQMEHAAAIEANRTSSTWVAWRDDRITQAAVGWVLTTVFLRFSEDNSLLSKVWISGPGRRHQEALDAENAYFRANPEDTWREWILEGVNHLGSFPATAGLVDDHAALWQVSPSGVMSKVILDFWRSTDEMGARVWDFQDDDLSTRFLGDLYQDLSEYAKKTFALLQTPEFVEEFILEQTLKPALAERPLEGFKLIDPTCGSGHFLLGGFQRMLDAWSEKAPNLETRERVQKALDAIHGVDLNPFAVAIARFRLTIAALEATGELDLERAPDFRIHLATGDSLLYGRADRPFEQEGFDLDASMSGFAYSLEDREVLEKILTENQYDVVVGNPPYITVKDKTLNERYRDLYKTCKGKYALSVPFMERFFRLAKFGTNTQAAGWTGQITSNSFMKREFGSKIIEDYLTSQDLRFVVDTSGAYIPGHGTPTVILIGKHQQPISQTVRAVLGIQGEPGRPERPSQGLVWRAIADNIDIAGHEDQWVSVVDLPRKRLETHPWSLSGGGASELLLLIDDNPASRLKDHAYRIGIFGIQGADDAMTMDWPVVKRSNLEVRPVADLVVGESVRDFQIRGTSPVWFPYSTKHQLINIESFPVWERFLWRLRTELGNRATFTKGTFFSDGRPYFEWHQLPVDDGSGQWTIAFAEVATHNHFVLDGGGKVFNRSAPVIKFPIGASKEDCLGLLGVLNSSTVCFWLRQACGAKGGSGVGRGIQSESWMERYNFNSSNVGEIPIHSILPVKKALELDALARELAFMAPAELAKRGIPTASSFSDARSRYESLRRQLIARQEELDWEVYGLYDLLDDDVTCVDGTLPEIVLGQRAFEIILARQMAAGMTNSAWFVRHDSTPVTEIPSEWPDEYRLLVQRRIDIIESNPQIGLLERPEHKRRWTNESWEKQQTAALQGWLLDRLEDRTFWFDAQSRPIARSIAQLADQVSRDSDLLSVLGLWSETVDIDVVKTLTKLLDDEAVPFLAAERLKEPGMRKRASWEETWDLQRREDAGEDVGTIPAPSKYSTADFQKVSWWQSRGKLDVPKERFILYPKAGRSTDPTLLLGWAGWDHVQQFLVLATLMDERIAEGADDSLLTSLVAGMAELLPWVKQWHSDMDPIFGMSMADFCAAQLDERMTHLSLSIDDLKAWRPAAATRGRRILKEKV